MIIRRVRLVLLMLLPLGLGLWLGHLEPTYPTAHGTSPEGLALTLQLVPPVGQERHRAAVTVRNTSDHPIVYVASSTCNEPVGVSHYYGDVLAVDLQPESQLLAPGGFQGCTKDLARHRIEPGAAKTYYYGSLQTLRGGSLRAYFRGETQLFFITLPLPQL